MPTNRRSPSSASERGATERLGLRDLHYSIRHRLYGDCPASDFDMIEFDKKTDEPLLIQEMKHGNIDCIDLGDAQIRRQKKVADALGVPFIITVYYFMRANGKWKKLLMADDDMETVHIQYFSYPGNELAWELLPPNGKEMTEAEHAQMLNNIRKQEMPKDITYYTTLDDNINPPRVIK